MPRSAIQAATPRQIVRLLRPLMRTLILITLLSVLAGRAAGQEVRQTRTALSVIPFLSYTPETRIMGGIGGFYTVRPDSGSDKRPSSIAMAAEYTQEGQAGAGMYPEMYAAEDRIRVTGLLEYYINPYGFFGIGNANTEGAREIYTPEGFRVHGTVIHAITGERVGRGLALGLRAELRYDDIQSIAPRADGGTPVLGQRTLAGSHGGWYNGLGIVALYDTRNSLFAPTDGELVEASVVHYGKTLGSVTHATTTIIDGRLYRPLADGLTYAAHVQIWNAGGSPIFTQIPHIGGASSVRGVYDGRYRDQTSIAIQQELRFPLFWRFSGAAFVDAGQVMPAWQQMRMGAFHYGIGGGVRFRIFNDDDAALRVDVGVHRGVAQLYVGFNEAF